MTPIANFFYANIKLTSLGLGSVHLGLVGLSVEKKDKSKWEWNKSFYLRARFIGIPAIQFY